VEHENVDSCAERILEIVARKAGIDPRKLTVKTRLLHDLSLYGDDAEELLVDVGNAFHVDFSGFAFERYFFPEGVAIWLLPRFLRQRATAKKQPLTIDALAAAARVGRWYEP
jgi:hypothetical protein